MSSLYYKTDSATPVYEPIMNLYYQDETSQSYMPASSVYYYFPVN